MARRVTLEPVVSKLEKFILYQTHSHMCARLPRARAPSVPRGSGG